MSLPLKFLCKKSKCRQDGTSVIKLQYCFSSERRTELDTEIPIPPKYWNKKSGAVNPDLPVCFGKAVELNERLDAMYRIAEDLIRFATKNKTADVISFVKEKFRPDFDVSVLHEIQIEDSRAFNTDFMFQYDEYSRLRMREIQENSAKVYTSLRRGLVEYQKYRNEKLAFDTFDEDKLHDLIYFFTYEYRHSGRHHNSRLGIKQNTLYNYMGRLCDFTARMKRKGVRINIDQELFLVSKEESDAVYLNWEEISKIYHMKIKNKRLSRSRYIFVLGCLTGLRFIDLTNIDANDIKNGFIKKKTDKTNTWVHIPIRKECAVILNMFGGKIPRVILWTFNRHIRMIGEMAGLTEEIKFSHKKGKKDIIEIKPKYAWLGSHTARRSFCTNEYLAGMPVELIMKISGHRSITSFNRYIKISTEEAAQKILEIWNDRRQYLCKPRKNASQHTPTTKAA